MSEDSRVPEAEDIPPEHFATQEAGLSATRALKGVREDSIEKETVQTEHSSITGWKWIDVASEGVDNTGSEDAAADLEELVEPNTALILSDGDYLFEERFSPDHSCALVGRGDATISFGTDNLIHTANNPVDKLVVSDIDIRDPEERGLRAFRVVVPDHGLFRVNDVKIRDKMDAFERGPARIDTGEGAYAEFNNFIAAEGSEVGTEGTGMLLYPDGPHSSIRLNDCRIENWPDNGVYSRRDGGEVGYDGQGRLVVDGGVYRNNGVTQLRTHTPHTLFDGPELRIDDDYPFADVTTRAIRLREDEPHTVRDPTIYVSDDNCIRLIEVFESAGDFTVRGADITVENCDVGFGIRNAEPEYEGSRAKLIDCHVKVTGTAIDESFSFLDSQNRVLTVSESTVSVEGDTVAVRLQNDKSRLDTSAVESGGRAVRVEADMVHVSDNEHLSSGDGSTVRIRDDAGRARVGGNNLEWVREDNDESLNIVEDNFDHRESEPTE